MPDDFADSLSLLNAYENGLTGYIESPRDKAEFLDSQPWQYFDEPNIKDSGKGQRALLWGYALACDPRMFEERQTTGDCTSHGSRGARDVTRASAIMVRGVHYSWFRRGATEPTYGARGHSGQGMSPARASKFERDVGFLARDKYPPCDLTKYDASYGIKWGGKGVPDDVQKLCNNNKVGRITNVRTQDDLMDAMFNGYAAHSGQNASWSNKPTGNIHRRTPQGWMHDMAILGYDDTKSHWPYRVWFVQNSWGKWNTPVPDWPSDYPPQPAGMIVTKDDDFNVCVSSGDCWVYGSIDGYPPQRLPDYGAIGLLSR
jgi:hypothetical protein